MRPLQVAHAVPEDAFELQLRPEDADEVSEGWRDRLAKTIRDEFGIAFRDDDGTLVALFGINRTPLTASPWLLCNERIEQHRATVWRRAKRVVQHVCAEYPDGMLIFNWVSKTSHENRAFILALGFVILPSPREGLDLFYLPRMQPTHPLG